MGISIKTLLINVLRFILLAAVVILCDQFVEFYTSKFLLLTALLFGIFAASKIAKTKLNFLGLTAGILLTVFAYKALNWLIFSLTPAGYFAPYYISEHINVIFIIFAIGSTTSFIFWRKKLYGNIELLFIALISVLLFAPHREYNLDFFKFINNLAWEYTTNPLVIICAIAFATFCILITYLVLINSFATSYSESQISHNYRNWPARVINSITFLSLLFITFTFSQRIYNYHQTQAEVATQNGVGSNDEEGVSPLNFDSASGTSSQPAALVKFANDYSENPFSPMLYLRESALSTIKGNEMVLADVGYDKDITRTPRNLRYLRKQPLYTVDRKELSADIFVLANLPDAFAIDYPSSILPLKLSEKNAKKFKAGFRTTSLVPTFSLQEMMNLEVGDPNWPESTWDHYLKNHQDTKYLERALSVASTGNSKLEQAAMIVAYLSKSATYTLTPHHERAEGSDPTAEFLFGDLRGYCVHFAHASVYMFRALGIPARIATGYLTDLSQAKDGHILLRMSDRHAWAEVYVQDLGWVPFDTTPENVENHADTPVDQNLLDDLIDSLATDDEVISDDLFEGEDFNQENTDKINLPNKKWLVLAFCILLASLILRKYYLYYAWRYHKKDQTLYFYRSITAALLDLNIEKQTGETKNEFFARFKERLGWQDNESLKNQNLGNNQDSVNNQDLVKTVNKIIYGDGKDTTTTNFDCQSFYKEFYQLLTWQQKLLMAINFRSVFTRLD